MDAFTQRRTPTISINTQPPLRKSLCPALIVCSPSPPVCVCVYRSSIKWRMTCQPVTWFYIPCLRLYLCRRRRRRRRRLWLLWSYQGDCQADRLTDQPPVPWHVLDSQSSAQQQQKRGKKKKKKRQHCTTPSYLLKICREIGKKADAFST